MATVFLSVSRTWRRCRSGAESEHDFFVPELQFEFVFDWDEHGHVDEMLFQPRRGQPMLPLRRIQPAALP
jgi:hypothetical protein